MNIFKKIANFVNEKLIDNLFKRDIMFFIREDIPPEVKSEEKKKDDKAVKDIYFKGAWQEDGVARWAFFKADEDNKGIQVDEDNQKSPFATVRLKPVEKIEVTLSRKIEEEKPEEPLDENHFLINDVFLELLKGKLASNRVKLISFLKGRKLNREFFINNLNKLEFDKEEIDLILEVMDKSRNGKGAIKEEIEVIPVLEKPEEEIKKEVKPESVVSITDLGRRLTSRYQSSEAPVPPVTLQIEKVSEKPEDPETLKEIKSSPDKEVIKDAALSSPANLSSEEEFPGLVDHRDIVGETKKIKLFFAEDNRSFQIVLKTLIKKTDPVELIGWASNGEEALEKIKKLETMPDVILMDIAMPRMNGIEAVKELLKFNPYLRIVMLTAFGDKEHVQEAFGAGAVGFLRKDAGLPLIKEAIKQAARGGRPVHKEVSKHLEGFQK